MKSREEGLEGGVKLRKQELVTVGGEQSGGKRGKRKGPRACGQK